MKTDIKIEKENDADYKRILETASRIVFLMAIAVVALDLFIWRP